MPPANCDDLMPYHVTGRSHSGHVFSTVTPAFEFSTRHCHHTHGPGANISAPDLNTLEAVDFAKRNVAPYISPILDTATMAMVCKDLGITGKAVPKVINGRQYIVLSGYSGFRNLLPGTVYSASNRKIVQMAIGSLGITNMVKRGARLTIYLAVSLTILECFLRDQTTMASLLGHVAMDLAKIGITAIMSAIFGLLAGAMVSSAAAPIFVAIAVSVLTGAALEIIDEKYGLTDKLVATIEQCGQGFIKKKDALEQTLGRTLQDAERGLIWRAYGFDIKNPLGLVPGMR